MTSYQHVFGPSTSLGSSLHRIECELLSLEKQYFSILLFLNQTKQLFTDMYTG